MRDWKALVFIALLLIALPVAAQDVVSGGDDGWTTPGGGQTQVNLSSFPVRRFLGADPTSSSVSLKGRPLDQANLGSVDTLISRPNNIALSGGTGSGEIRIEALSLESESDVTLTDGRKFKLRVCLSRFDSGAGTITLSRANSDGGTFSSALPVLPKLIFTPVAGGSAVTIDCGTGVCSEMTMASSNSGWVNTGGSGNFNPATAGETPIRSGIDVDGDCDGVKDNYRTVGKGTGKTFHAGFSAQAPTFPPVSVGERHEDLSWHQPLPALDCKTTSTTSASRVVKGSAVASPTPVPVLCPATPVEVKPVSEK
jgi:hypothetical protein